MVLAMTSFPVAAAELELFSEQKLYMTDGSGVTDNTEIKFQFLDEYALGF